MLHSTRTHAKLRARRRAESGGAVIFIIAMTLAVLLSMGAYAMQAASTEIKTSGFVRQSMQTHYLTEYGILGTAHFLQGSNAQLYLDLAKAPKTRDHLPEDTSPGRSGIVCPSLAYVPASANPFSLACRRMPASEVSQLWGPLTAPTGTGTATSYPALVPYDPTAPRVPGSLGAAPVTGNFIAELTDPAQGKMEAGYGTDLKLCFAELTLTTTGLTFPQNSSGIAQFTGQTIETARARITAGPVKCP